LPGYFSYHLLVEPPTPPLLLEPTRGCQRAGRITKSGAHHSAAFFTMVSGFLVFVAVVYVAVIQLLGSGFPQVNDFHLEVQLLAR
jgi:hypothetical protein